MIQKICNFNKRIIHSYRKDESGSPTIEFVTTLPLALSAFVFAFEFSRLFWAHHVATNNVRSAIRYLSRAPLDATHIDRARNMVRTGNPNTATGAYDWMADIADSNINIDTAHEAFATPNFRTNGQVIRIQLDVPFNFMTVNMFNNLGRMGDGVPGTLPAAITLNIIEEARYIGE